MSFSVKKQMTRPKNVCTQKNHTRAKIEAWNLHFWMVYGKFATETHCMCKTASKARRWYQEKLKFRNTDGKFFFHKKFFMTWLSTQKNTQNVLWFFSIDQLDLSEMRVTAVKSIKIDNSICHWFSSCQEVHEDETSIFFSLWTFICMLCKHFKTSFFNPPPLGS